MRRRDLSRVRVVLAGLTVVAVAFGCTAISGVDDFQVGQTAPISDSNMALLDATAQSQDVSRNELATDVNANEDAGARDAAPPAKRVFLTSATFNGSLGGLIGADAQCRAAATAAGLGSGEWRAWLSTSSVNAISRLPYVGAYSLVDGTVVSNDATELASGTLRHAIDLDEYGSLAGTDGGTTVVWTSTNDQGQVKSSSVCLDWSSASYWDWGETGSATNLDTAWTNGGGRRCIDGAHIYCFEE